MFGTTCCTVSEVQCFLSLLVKGVQRILSIESVPRILSTISLTS